ncbi:MAG: hypothetical protein RLZZ15_438 [Verrucomicrobiota bacterium]
MRWCLRGRGGGVFGVAQDAVGGAFADGQLKQVHEPAGAEAGGLFPGGDDLGGGGLGRAFGGVVRVAGVVGEGVVAVVPAVKPEAHGGAGAFVAPRGGAQAVGFGVAHEFAAEREFGLGGAGHGAIESEPGVGLSLHPSASPREAPAPVASPTSPLGFPAHVVRTSGAWVSFLFARVWMSMGLSAAGRVGC